MTSFWLPSESTTGILTGPRDGCSSGFFRRGSTCYRRRGNYQVWLAHNIIEARVDCILVWC